MMVLLGIHLGIGAGVLMMYLIAACDASRRYRYKYPNSKKPTRTFIGCISSLFRMLIISVTPLLNLFMVYTLVFRYEEAVEKSIEKAHASVLSEVM